MAGPIDSIRIMNFDKRLKNLVEKWNNAYQIYNKEQTGDMRKANKDLAVCLKEIFGKDGLLVLTCKMGNDTNTLYHCIANELRKKYVNLKLFNTLDIKNMKSLQKKTNPEIEKLREKFKTLADSLEENKIDLFSYEVYDSFYKMCKFLGGDNTVKITNSDFKTAPAVHGDSFACKIYNNFTQDWNQMVKNMKAEGEDRNIKEQFTTFLTVPVRVMRNGLWQGVILGPFKTLKNMLCDEIIRANKYTPDDKKIINIADEIESLMKKLQKLIIKEKKLEHSAEELIKHFKLNLKKLRNLAKKYKMADKALIQRITYADKRGYKTRTLKQDKVRRCRYQLSLIIQNLGMSPLEVKQCDGLKVEYKLEDFSDSDDVRLLDDFFSLLSVD